MRQDRGLTIWGIALAACAVGLSGPARADVVTYNGNLVNGVYFGSGNVNGGWTISTNTDTVVGAYTNDEFEIGLRAKNYGGAVITPETGTGIYDSTTGLANASHAVWNWEFSIDNLTGGGLAGLTADLTISHTGSGTTNTFDVLSGVPIADNTVGDGGNGQQNSENMKFKLESLPDYSPWNGDSYTYTLTLRDGGTPIATDTITVNAVPEPASMALLAFGLTGLGAIRRRRRQAVVAG